MPGSEGVVLFKQKCPALEILMLTVHAEQEKVFESICNGACGYLLKETPPAKLLEAIDEARHGGAPMSPEIARKMVTLFRRRAAGENRSTSDPQETRLLKLFAEGTSTGAAEQLNISVNTVRDHIEASTTNCTSTQV
jgi:DNA-binding NarL/FixJ family response regulator